MDIAFRSVKTLIEDDEVCRVTRNGDLQFGIVLKENGSGSYVVDWKCKSKQVSFIENRFNLSNANHDPVTLIDRRHSEGSRVIHTDGRIGAIVDGYTLAWIYLPGSKHLVKDIPSEQLRPITLFTGELIELNGNVGKVSSVDWIVTVQFSDGVHCNFTTTQTHRSNTSFGYEVYSKLSPPCTNNILYPTKKEFNSAEWHGKSWFENAQQAIQDHQKMSATVVGSKIGKVYVKWLYKLSHADTNVIMPRVLDTAEEIDAIKQFDIKFREWFTTHSICEYTVREPDQLIEENDFENIFISELCEETSSNPGKKPRIETQAKSSLPALGQSVLAEVIRLRHIYNVRWISPSVSIDSAQFELVLGTSLTPWCGLPLSPYGFDVRKSYTRAFVESKVLFPLIEEDPEKVFGVTQNHYLRDELVEVLWYKKEAGGVKFLGPSVSASYEVLPHTELRKLKPGAVVTDGQCKNNRLTVGMVVRVNQSGMVEVFWGTDDPLKVFNPFELIVLTLPKDEFSLPSIHRRESAHLDAEKLDFAQSLANDIEELLEISPQDIKIKITSVGSLDSFSVLIIGPKSTPYEDGIFIFDVQLPRDYPNSAPKIQFRSTPQGQAFLSPNLTSDGEVRLAILDNWPGKDFEKWDREYSLLDFLLMIRDEIFVCEPFLNRADLKFDKNKDRLASEDNKALAAMTQLNGSVVVTVVDLMLSQYQSPSTNWTTEIADHVKSVAPRIQHKLQSWIDSPVGIFGDLKEYPKYHIFPISFGLKQALARRVDLLDEMIQSSVDTQKWLTEVESLNLNNCLKKVICQTQVLKRIMSILFPDHVTAYYIPNAVHLYNVFKNSLADYPIPPVLEGNVANTRRRFLEYRYKDHKVVPVASTATLEDIVTTQKVESHPESSFQGKTWCIIQYEYPPDQKKECHYMIAMDQALLERYDAIIIEPFTVSQRAEQWINIITIIYSGFSSYLAIAIVASIHSSLMDPAPAFASLVSLYLLRTYRKYIQGDPVAVYRNFDMDSNADMNFMHHMSELLEVHARFTNVLIKDIRRDRYRMNILKGLILTQFIIVSYKFSFGLFLKVAFGDRPQ